MDLEKLRGCCRDGLLKIISPAATQHTRAPINQAEETEKDEEKEEGQEKKQKKHQLN